MSFIDVLILMFSGRLFFSDVSYLVLDEADSMFDKTFKSETMDLLQTMSVGASVNAEKAG